MRLVYLALHTEKKQLLQFMARSNGENFYRVIAKSLVGAQFDEPDCELVDLGPAFAEWLEGDEVTIVSSFERWRDYLHPNFSVYCRLASQWVYLPTIAKAGTMLEVLYASERAMFQLSPEWRNYV